MSFFLPKLSCKKDIDDAVKSVAEKVLVLRFGRDEDSVCLQLDEILSKTAHDLSNMASIYLVDVDTAPVYTRYFDISFIPSTVFFFNGQHMKVDYGKSSVHLMQAFTINHLARTQRKQDMFLKKISRSYQVCGKLQNQAGLHGSDRSDLSRRDERKTDRPKPDRPEKHP
ncbi:thioredoxin-like protein 4B isoform X1 [Onychostoma macrolepis]|uniref:thioredoxin-like protein 4B isoform X1 n=1 Tax=Onychostoma macrolepis TaxID=369639 RepID=UPI002729DE73|nr:thioredoxin-like protein 4B isoform X1 [Onychostoma macrolepis]